MNLAENCILANLIIKARQAAQGDLGVLSDGEQIAVASVLDRADWLDERQVTLAQAIDRLGPYWLAVIPKTARVLEDEGI